MIDDEVKVAMTSLQIAGSILEDTHIAEHVLERITEHDPQLANLTHLLDIQTEQREASSDPKIKTKLEVGQLPKDALSLQGFLVDELAKYLINTKDRGDRLNQALVIASLTPIYREYPLLDVAEIYNLIDLSRDQLARRWYPATYQRAKAVLDRIDPDRGKHQFDISFQTNLAIKELQSLGIDTSQLAIIGNQKSVVKAVTRAVTATPDPYQETNNPWQDTELEYWGMLPPSRIADLENKITAIPDLRRARAYANTTQAFIEAISMLAKGAKKIKLSLWDYDGYHRPNGESSIFLDPIYTQQHSKAILYTMLSQVAETPEGNIRYAAMHIHSDTGREWQLQLNNLHLIRPTYLTGNLLKAHGDMNFIGTPSEVVSGFGRNARIIASEIINNSQLALPKYK